LVMLTILNIS